MKKHTFRYCSTHKGDEAYMQQMCARGWAAVRLVEGVWTFEACEPNQYCYRIAYLRGLREGEVEALKKQYAARGISFVSRYSFWAIFRSPEPFRLYSPEEDREICRKMYAPMPVGAGISWLLMVVGSILAWRISPCFWLLAVPAGLYGSVCTWLALAYHRLLKRSAE